MALFIFMLQSIRDAIIRPGQIAPLRFIQAHNRHYNSETFMQHWHYNNMGFSIF